MVRSHRYIALAIALILALIVAAPASAKFARGLPSATSHPSHPASTAPVVRVAAASPGFHWGDAGIGAAGALGLTVLVLGAALAVPHTRRRAARDSAQATI